MYPIDCLCGVITRSHLLSLMKQLCIMINCLFPYLSLDIRFRMMDAILNLVISNVLNYYVIRFFVVSLIWVVFIGLERKAYINS